MNPWLLYPILSAPMPFQMAFDEILFRRAENQGGLPVLRFYFSSGPWISVGFSYRTSVIASERSERSNPALETVGFKDREVLSSDRTEGNPVFFIEGGPSSGGKSEIASTKKQPRNDSIPICRRITGGGLVRHGRDLIFSLIAKKSDDESFKSVRTSYWKIHEAVKAGLEGLGKVPRFYRCDEKLPRGGDCFRFPIATDLAVENQKAAGGAQKRSAGTLLHQESVQWKAMPAPETLVPALKSGFEKIFQVILLPSDLDPALLAEAEQLAGDKYNQTQTVPGT